MTFKIDTDRTIIERTVSGGLYTERPFHLVREIALGFNTHKGYNVLMGMHATETKPELLDLMKIAATSAKLKTQFAPRSLFSPPIQKRASVLLSFLQPAWKPRAFPSNRFSTDRPPWVG